VNEKGLTLVALRLYWKAGRAKAEIGLARGKKLYDKRATIRERDEKLEMDRAMRLCAGRHGLRPDRRLGRRPA
jgi:SsrA-binding protein